MQKRILFRLAILLVIILAAAQIGLLPVTAQTTGVPPSTLDSTAASMDISRVAQSNTSLAPSTSNRSIVTTTAASATCLIYAVDRKAGNNSQFFTIDLRAKTVRALGSLLANYDIKGLAIHPDTRILYAASSKDAAVPGQLYVVDSQTATLSSVGNTGFNDIRALTFRPTDASLWGWSASAGLIQIDITTGVGTLRFATTKSLEGLAWSNDGTRLYGVAETNLWAYDPGSNTIQKLTSDLPGDTEAIQMRPDGLLIGSIDHEDTVSIFAYDANTMHTVSRKSLPSDYDDVVALAWPAACGNPSTGGPANIIKQVVVDKTQICAGDSVLVTVMAEHPESPQGRVDITINGQWGNPQFVQFTGVPGKRFIDVTASTPEKYTDRRQLTVEMLPCDASPPLPIMHIRPNLYHDLAIDFEIANAAALDRQMPTYTWDFGDGQTAQTTVPAISHFYGDGIDTDKLNSVFQASVTVHQDGRTDLVTHKTVTIWNTYALNKQRGFIQPRITANPDVQMVNGILTGDYTITNLENTPIQLISRQVQFQFCDPDQPDRAPMVEGIALQLGAHQALPQHMAIPILSLPPDTCGIYLLLKGQTSTAIRVYGGVSFQVKVNPHTIQEITDPAVSDRLNQIMSQRLLGDATTISDEDLYRLAQQGRISHDMQNQLALSGTTAHPSPQDDGPLNQPCTPGEPPPAPYLTCQISNDWYYRPAYIANAQKGDVILSPGCHGTIGELLRNVDPPQLYSHSGIMTRDRYEVRHATASEARYQSYPVGTDPLGNPAPSDGFRPDILRYGWPGTITQPIYKAFESEDYIDPENHQHYRIDGFSHNPTGCDGEAAEVFPLVVKPAPERESELRPLLRAAADQALALDGHYRFYGYSDGAIAGDPAYTAPPESGWAAGTAAVVCSTFIWDTMKLAHIVLEGPDLEPSDYAHGAERDATTQDGMYLYRATERQKAGHTLYNRTYNHVLDEAKRNTCFGLPCGLIWAFFTDAADDIGNQLANCFDTDWCDTPAKDSDRWQHTGEGRSVSPDNILFWDVWSAPQQGIYGYNERMAYRPGVYARDRWQRSGPAGTVSGHVFFEGAPAANALVRVAGLEQTTDDSGAYSFVAVPAGSYQIEASKQISPNRTVTDQQDVTVVAGNTTTIDLHLGLPAQPQAIVHVTVERLHGFGCWGMYVDPPWPFPTECIAPDTPDFYARVSIDGHESSTRDHYVEDQWDISPNWDFSSLVDASRANIPITIHVGDVDDFLRFDDDDVDVKPDTGRDLNMLLDLTDCSLSGDATGGCNAQIHSAGDDADGHEDRADIWFHVSVEFRPPMARQARMGTQSAQTSGTFLTYLPLVATPPPARSTTGWEGSTSSGQHIEFRLTPDGSTITEFSLNAVVGSCGVVGIGWTHPLTITNGRFSLSTSALSIAGQLTSPTTAQGTYAVHISIPSCGETSERGTWTARGL